MKKIDWIKLVSRRHSLFRLDLLNRGTPIQVKKVWGIDYDDQMFISSPKLNAWFCSKEKINNLGNYILNRVQKERGFAEKIAAETEKSCLELVKTTKKITAGNLGKITNKQLALRLRKYVEAHNEFCTYFDVSNSIKEIGTQQIKDGLVKLLKAKGKEKLLNDYLEKLLKPDKNPLTNQEQIELGKIKIGDEAALKKHAKKYEWLSVYNPDEPVLPCQYFKDRMKDLLKNKPKEKKLEPLAIPANLQKLIKVMKKYVYLHTFRAEMLSKSYFLLKAFLTEMAVRWKTDLETICALTPGEIIEALEKGIQPDLEEAKRRRKTYFHLMKAGVIKIYSGKEAERYFLQEVREEQKEKTGKQIKGLVASQGLAEGRVRVIVDKRELEQMEEGEILVATMTSPDYVYAIQKSGAVVTDEGGLLCHAAIISREMRKPCVVGTRVATTVFKTGDLVKVDAYEGIITRK